PDRRLPERRRARRTGRRLREPRRSTTTAGLPARPPLRAAPCSRGTTTTAARPGGLLRPAVLHTVAGSGRTTGGRAESAAGSRASRGAVPAAAADSRGAVALQLAAAAGSPPAVAGAGVRIRGAASAGTERPGGAA